MVLTFERNSGLRSSGLTFLLWLALSVYGSFKIRTLVLISEDMVGLPYDVCEPVFLWPCVF